MRRRTPLLFALCALLAASLSTAGTADAAKKGHKKKTTAKTARARPAAPAAPREDAPSFDREAASMAVASIDLTKCRATSAERGEGHVMITFTPAGSVSSAAIDKGPWIGTPIAKCMAGQFKKAKIPAFGGEPVTVGKTFRFE
jgi:hypothetical protein